MRKTNFIFNVIVVSTFFVVTLLVFSLTGDVRGHMIGRESNTENTSTTALLTEPTLPTVAPTATPSPTPTIVPAYVPEFEDFPDHFWIDTMPTLPDGMSVTENENGFEISWMLQAKADYYVLCTSGNGAEYIPFQILSPSVFEWEYMEKNVAGFMLLAYEDNGQEGMDDDVMLRAYRSMLFTPEVEPDINDNSAENTTGKYKIIVDKEDCAFAVFEKDENGEYTVCVATYPAALGGRKTPLSSERRQFTIGRKLEWRTWTGYSPDRYSPYASQYSSGIFFHGPIYRRKSFDTLMKYSYDDIGSDYKTGGCVRTTVAGARFVYYACPAGTVVEIVSSSDWVSYPGKPAIDASFPTWDPTDPQKPTPAPVS
ncbi:MAG: L,D-transpeptidase [Clostridiaceae bacterium]|nr:L,D-transpeptidase [Clostridiaceae bacterium]